MSVKPFVAATLLLALLPLNAQALRKPQIIHKAEQLIVDSKQLKAFKAPYQFAAGASVIYDRCSSELNITPQDHAFFRKRYAALTGAYLKAFDDAFVEKWKVHSDAKLTKDYMRYMREQAAPVIAEMEKAVIRPGCTDRRTRMVLEYYRKIQAAEASGLRVPMVKEIQKKEDKRKKTNK